MKTISTLFGVIILFTGFVYSQGIEPGTKLTMEQQEWLKRTPKRAVEITDKMWDKYQRDVPEWYQDAKFGIYAHWGPYNVGMEKSGYTGGLNSWYAKFIYVKGHPYNIHHIKNFGPLKEFGYKEYFPLFTVPKFDPDEWAELVATSGAKFAGPVAMHHEGFAMWDSEVVEWDAPASGAKRDIAGELIDAYRKKDLHIVSSFHHAFNVSGEYYGGRPGKKKESNVDFDSDLNDPAYAGLYGKFDTQEEAEQYWLDILKEYITKYKPDQLWFDGGLSRLSHEILYEMTSFYYDFCAKEGIEGIISQKNDQIPRRVSVLDYERGGDREIAERTWQTDDSPGPWMYIEAMEFKGAEWVIPLIIDITSKNGVLLLNIAPLADGSIHPQQQQMLRETGKWLEVYGEAIYTTRPWKTHYQGPSPNFYVDKKVFAEFTSGDLRFTTSKDGKNLYVIVMAEPEEEIVIESLKTTDLSEKAKASLLGSGKNCELSENADGKVVILTPDISWEGKGLKGYPVAFKIFGLK